MGKMGMLSSNVVYNNKLKMNYKHEYGGFICNVKNLIWHIQVKITVLYDIQSDVSKTFELLQYD